VIRIMTFNIRNGTAADGENSWPHRKELVVDRIRAFDPDVLGLQECRDDFQAAYLKAALGDYAFVGRPRGGDHPASLEMTAVFIRKSAFEVVERSHFWLSQTPDVPGSMSWDSHFPRTVTWVKLEGRQPPHHRLALFNTHFDYNGEEVVTESARLLRTRVEGLLGDMPVILTGDFNAEKDTLAYRILTEGTAEGAKKLNDVYRQVHPERTGNEGTAHDFGTLVDQPAIDWILISGHLQATWAEIDRYNAAGRYPSDHYPLAAVVELREARP